MLADMTREDWLGVLGLREGEVPRTLVMRGTRNLKTRLAQYRDLLGDAREIMSPNGIFEDLLLGSHQATPIAVACVYGAPMASEIAHVFCVLGVSKVILTGCCGALSPEVAAGDIVIPDQACCGDGASRYYGAQWGELVAADPVLREAAAGRVSAEDWPVHPGTVFTTAALCAESAADVATWAQAGRVAVDMETATTYAVARRFGVPAIALLFAFDCLATGETVAMTDREKSARRARGEGLMTAAAFDLATRG